ncbi:MAG: serine/threonine protein kinase [Kofleriaceae bacterium]|nr:serine/threonine protein kinase [Kofleriaceae bacterium]
MTSSAAPLFDVGTELGKYRLLGRVGQGGMSVVYRALDQSLGRDVAIKVLHSHLAESQEARDRFAREARAVAKLRHPNILEIYDYSGAHDARADASYIVTEFIDGQTLKQFVTAQPLGFPEIAALIVMDIAAALAHAHEALILHRDIKPENVMIRRDGAIKLMDFGISHMVDLERLTVTGQLLGSPAYMAPEHVDGKPIDYRTDIFALGTVLYQLTTGQLPFSGKNAHEVLKRIVEGRFTDPRHVNPAIGNQLGRIILRAMAVNPNDRFQTVADFRTALAAYITDSGIENPTTELAAYFADPIAFDLSFRPRLAGYLVRHGNTLLAHGNQAAALDAFDRVLAIEPANHEVLMALRQLRRRRTTRNVVLAGMGIAAAVAGTVVVHHQVTSADGASDVDAASVNTAHTDPRHLADAPNLSNIPAGLDATVTAAVPPDAAPSPLLDRVDAATNAIVRPNRDARRELDAAPTQPVALIATLSISPPSSEYSVDNGPWKVAVGGRQAITLTDGPVRVAVRNDACCEAKSRVITLTDANTIVPIALAFLPAQLTPKCSKALSVRIDDRMATLGQPWIVPFGETTNTTRRVTVEFVGEGIDRHVVTLRPADNREVSCALR